MGGWVCNVNRLRVTVDGLLQGVGFRPFITRLAAQLELTGWVANQGSGALLEIQGTRVADFEPLLITSLPAHMLLREISSEVIKPIADETEFLIKKSLDNKFITEFVPDLGICNDCIKELFDSSSNYYLYPFINCIACGPRYSITKQLPYDRHQTTLHEFVMCNRCQQEYQDPLNRRYHAQPIACTECGPSFEKPLDEIAKLIKANEIIALKALGGYQLICDAFSSEAIIRLRHAKNRPYKPLALMLPNIETIKYYYHCSEQEAKTLLSPERPIVLLKIKKTINNTIAPGLNYHGVMLPYTGIHYLLFYFILKQPKGHHWHKQLQTSALIVTSGNLPGAALITEDTQAKKQLSTIASDVIAHNRKIYLPVDDSIIKYINTKPQLIRRARGFVPNIIKLKKKTAPMLALGCHLKNTLAFSEGHNAYVSQYLGTLDNASTIDYLHQCLKHFQKFFNLKITHVVHDAHPDIYTTKLANTLDYPTIAVQHHHAHVASVMAEHQLDEPVLGWALDGFGYAEPRQAWGGELLLIDGAHAKPLLSLKPYPLPGGDLAAKQPWRMALSLLSDLKHNELLDGYSSKGSLYKNIIERLKAEQYDFRSSACGRYFDAASALLNVCDTNSYEGEAAMRLEALVTKPSILANGWAIKNSKLDFSSLWQKLCYASAREGANLFHGTLAAALAESAIMQLQALGLNKLILTGGCTQNKTLIESMLDYFKKAAVTVYMPQQLPANDGGLCLGQLWVASYSI